MLSIHDKLHSHIAKEEIPRISIELLYKKGGDLRSDAFVGLLWTIVSTVSCI